MRTRILLVLTAAALLAGGCSGDDDKAATTTTGAVTTTVAVTTSTPAVVTTGAATTTVPAAAAVVLRPDGLGVVAFGATEAATTTALTAAFGSIDETGTGCELGGAGTTTARWDELRVEFSPTGVFRSYNVRPPNGTVAVLGLKTEAGIGLGSTVAQLKAAYGSDLTIPGLPPEFGGDDFRISFAGTDRGIVGSLTATTDAGIVRDIFTQVCE